MFALTWINSSIRVDASCYCKIIVGKKSPKAEMTFAIAERWGVTLDFLYRGNLNRVPERYAKATIARIAEAKR